MSKRWTLHRDFDFASGSRYISSKMKILTVKLLNFAAILVRDLASNKGFALQKFAIYQVITSLMLQPTYRLVSFRGYLSLRSAEIANLAKLFGQRNSIVWQKRLRSRACLVYKAWVSALLVTSFLATEWQLGFTAQHCHYHLLIKFSKAIKT